MTYASGGLIQAADYNTLAWGSSSGGTYVNSANAAYVWGTGNGRYGMGQSTSGITQVAAGNTVTAAQWTSLLNVINNTLQQEGQSAISPTSVASGGTVTYYSAINTGLTNAYNGMGAEPGPFVYTYAAPAFTSAWGTTGNRRLVFTNTLTFSSGDAARYFFNAGGLIQINFTRSGGSPTTRNTDWTNLASNCGYVTIGYRNTTKAGGGGATPSTLLNASNGGYWNLTTSAVTHFQQFDNTSPYTTDYIQVQVNSNGVQGANGDVGSVITMNVYWVNAYSNTFQPGVDGTATTQFAMLAPPTTYISNTWGTPTLGAGSVVSN